VVSLIFQLLYILENRPPNTHTIGHCGPKSWSGYFGEEKNNLLSLSGIEALLFSNLAVAYGFYGSK
jgi:hypothetical protein